MKYKIKVVVKRTLGNFGYIAGVKGLPNCWMVGKTPGSALRQLGDYLDAQSKQLRALPQDKITSRFDKMIHKIYNLKPSPIRKWIAINIQYKFQGWKYRFENWWVKHAPKIPSPKYQGLGNCPICGLPEKIYAVSTGDGWILYQLCDKKCMLEDHEPQAIIYDWYPYLWGHVCTGKDLKNLGIEVL